MSDHSDPQFIVQRTNQLKFFINALLDVPHVSDMTAVHLFLGLGNHVRTFILCPFFLKLESLNVKLILYFKSKFLCFDDSTLIVDTLYPAYPDVRNSCVCSLLVRMFVARAYVRCSCVCSLLARIF